MRCFSWIEMFSRRREQGERQRKAQIARWRRAHFEQLESRVLLSAESPAQIHYEILSTEAARTFAIDTVVGDGGAVRGVIRMAENAELDPSTQYDFDVAIQWGDQTIATRRVFVVLPKDGMVEAFQDYRLTKAQEDLAAALDPSEPDEPEGSSASENVAIDLKTLAEQVSAADPLSEAQREQLYLELSALSADVGDLKDAAEPGAKELSRQLGATAYLLVDRFAADMESNDPSLASAAHDAAQDAFEQADLSYKAWTGLGINSDVYAEVRSQEGELQFSAWYEAGELALTPEISIALDRPAVVMAVGGAAQAGASVPYGSTVKSGVAAAATEVFKLGGGNPGSPFMNVNSSGGNQVESFVQFDLASASLGLTSPLVTDAIVTLFPGYVAQATTHRAQVVYNNRWTEGSLTWANRPTTGPTSEPWQLSPNPSPVNINVTAAVRRELRYGDADFSGGLDGEAGGSDFDAFELYVRDHAAYMEQYGALATFGTDTMLRADYDADGVFEYDDIAPFFIRQGLVWGDVNLDDTANIFDIGTISEHWDTVGSPSNRYEDGDANFDAMVQIFDVGIVSDHWLQTTSAPEAPKLSLRVYDPGSVNSVVFYWANNQTWSPNSQPKLTVTQTPDLLIDKFYVENGQLKVDYRILHGEFDGGFTIAVKGRRDSGADLELMSYEVTGTTNLSPGSHTASFSANFTGDSAEDYRLVAVLDSGGEFAEHDETNNERFFGGGAFLDNGGTLEIHGTDLDDAFILRVWGDANGDGLAGVQDVAYVVDPSRWLQTGPDGDLNDDGIVNFGDLGLISDAMIAQGSTGPHLQIVSSAHFGYSDGVPPHVPIGDVSEIRIRLHADNDIVTMTGASSVARPVLAYGGAGNDQILSGAGNDTLKGGAGDDELRGGAAQDVIFGGDGADTLWGGAGDDSLTGESGHDILYGDADDDVLTGGTGDDTFAFAGSDDLGTDTIVDTSGANGLDFSELDFGQGVIVALAPNPVSQQVINANGKQLTIERGTSTWAVPTIVGTSYGDFLSNYSSGTLRGGPSNDTLKGSIGADILDGGSGNDILEGGRGDDELYGGPGDDSFRFWSPSSGAGVHDLGTDAIFEYDDEGSDTLDYSDYLQDFVRFGVDLDLGITGGEYVVLDEVVSQLNYPGLPNGYASYRHLALDLSDTPELENVVGTRYNDTLRGDDGDNQLIGGFGEDTLIGMGGDDTLDAGSDSGTITFTGSGDHGHDVILGIGALDFSELDFDTGVSLDLRVPELEVVGPGGNRVSLDFSAATIYQVIGTAFDDVLIGDGNGQTFYGRGGDDWLQGREGNDTLRGESGYDTYSIIAGETTFSDNIVDTDEYSKLFANGTSDSTPRIIVGPGTKRTGKVAATTTSAGVLATISDLETPTGNLVSHVSVIAAGDISITPAGEILWSPDANELGASYSITIQVWDAQGRASTRQLTALVVPEGDSDGDTLDDVYEVNDVGTDHNDFDTDGDLLSDDFEHNSDVLDPLSPDGIDDDPDEDELDNLDEQIHDTDPGEPDSDGDGSSDGEEVDQGSDPNDSSDLGLAPPDDEVVDLHFEVGDESTSNSERYDLIVGPIRHQARTFGELEPGDYRFRKGETHSITVVHRDSILSPPDLDYTADITLSAGEESLVVIEDPEDILRIKHSATNPADPFYAEGKVAYLHIPEVDLDIIEPGNIEVSDDDERDPGSFLPLNSDDDDNDGIVDLNDSSITGGDNDFLELKLRSLLPARMQDFTGTLTISFDTSKVRVWKDRNKSQSVVSETTEFDVSTDNTIYVEGIAPSAGSADVLITADYSLESTGSGNFTVLGESASDTVAFTVVQVDLDLDSNNDGTIGTADGPIEDDSSRPGKWVPVNERDLDGDGIPDFADGLDALEHTAASPGQFTPLRLNLSGTEDPSSATIVFTYDDANPSLINPLLLDPMAQVGGHLAIWAPGIAAGQARYKRNAASFPNGDWITSGQAISLSQLGMTAGGSVTVWVEGLVPSASIGGDSIMVTVDPDGPGPRVPMTDRVRLTVVSVDADVDSDNTSGTFGSPNYTNFEDNVEEKTNHPGRIVPSNNGNFDLNDSIPDFADGFSVGSITQFSPNASEHFTPIVVRIPEPLDLAYVKLSFQYSASDPALADTHNINDAPGQIRLWLKDGREARDGDKVGAGGDWIDPHEKLTPAQLGFGTERTRTFYIEGLSQQMPLPGEIIVSVWENGTTLVVQDRVQYTVAQFAMEGTIEYDPNTPKAVRRAMVTAQSGGVEIGRTWTTDTGYYFMPLEYLPQGYANITLYVHARTRPAGNGPGDTLRAVRVQGLELTENAVWFRVPFAPNPNALPSPTRPIGETDFDDLTEATNSGRAFWTFDALVTASEYHSTVAGVGPGEVFANSPAVFVPGSHYNLNGQINLEAEDYKNWDTILHEYGHAVADEAGFFTVSLTELQHSTENNTRHTQGDHNKETVQLAFSEGWANFYSLLAQAEAGVSSPPVLDDTEEGGDAGDGELYDFDPEDRTGDRDLDSFGQDHEIAVMRILWDLYDSGSESYDRVTMTPDEILSVLVVHDVTTVDELLQALTANATLEKKNDFGAIFSAHGVGAQELVMLVDGQASTVAGPISTVVEPFSPPQFRWKIPQSSSGADVMKADFGMLFYDDQGNVVLDIPPSAVQFSVDANDVATFVPTHAQWGIIAAALGGRRWVVYGFPTPYPNQSVIQYLSAWYEFTIEI